MTKQKAVGTSAETALVNWLHLNGYPEARRIALAGRGDRGDVEICPGVVAEVKSRRPTTSNAGVGQPGKAELLSWMHELAAECENGGYPHGWLIVKRTGTTKVNEWWAYTWPHQIEEFLGLQPSPLVIEAEKDMGAWYCMTVLEAMNVTSRGYSG